MIYLYRNKYSREKFYFDSVRLKAYRWDDERMKTCRTIDMRAKDIITPYSKFGIVAKGDLLLIVTKRKMISVWYNCYSYEFVYDDGVYMNDEIISGTYDVQYRNCPVEYLFLDSYYNVRMGIGLKRGGIRIQVDGICRYNEEKYNGEYISRAKFEARL